MAGGAGRPGGVAIVVVAHFTIIYICTVKWGRVHSEKMPGKARLDEGSLTALTDHTMRSPYSSISKDSDIILLSAHLMAHH